MAWFGPSKAQQISHIDGESIFLRAPRMEDFAQWATLRQVSRQFLEPWEPSWLPGELSRPAYRQRVKLAARLTETDMAYAYHIFDRSTHRLVGAIHLNQVRRGISQSCTLGYWVGEAFAGQGYMKNALQLVLAANATKFHMHRFEAACLPHNERSKGLLISCGFAQEGLAKDYLKILGRWEDHLLFGRVMKGII